MCEDEQDVWLRPGGEQRGKSQEKKPPQAFYDGRSLTQGRQAVCCEFSLTAGSGPLSAATIWPP
jgi:hypothetical protein